MLLRWFSMIYACAYAWGLCPAVVFTHDDVIKWKHFPRYWPFVRGIHRGPVNSPHKGQWRGALMYSLICAWINGWVNNGEAGDLRRHCAHYDVIVMWWNACPGRISIKPENIPTIWRRFAICCFSLWALPRSILPISVRVISLALRQSKDCLSASEVTLKNMGECITWIHMSWWYNRNEIKQKKKQQNCELTWWDIH